MFPPFHIPVTPLGGLCWAPPQCGGPAPGLGAPPHPRAPHSVPNWIHLEELKLGGEKVGGAPKSLMGKAEGQVYGVRGDVLAERGRGSPLPEEWGGSLLSKPPPETPTHHHQECRKPGGSPRVMFFSHRICREGHGEGRGGQQPPKGWGSRTPRGWFGGVRGCCPPPLTSDKKVWADFWAPTCSRYS